MGRGASTSSRVAGPASRGNWAAHRRGVPERARTLAERASELCRSQPGGASQLCTAASVLLCYQLRRTGFDATVVGGRYRYTRDVSGTPHSFACNHAWVQYTDRNGCVHVLDPTREQFPGAAPLVEPLDGTNSYLPDPQEFPDLPARPGAEDIVRMYVNEGHHPAYAGGRLMRLINALAPECAAACRSAARHGLAT